MAVTVIRGRAGHRSSAVCAVQHMAASKRSFGERRYVCHFCCAPQEGPMAVVETRGLRRRAGRHSAAWPPWELQCWASFSLPLRLLPPRAGAEAVRLRCTAPRYACAMGRGLGARRGGDTVKGEREVVPLPSFFLFSVHGEARADELALENAHVHICTHTCTHTHTHTHAHTCTCALQHAAPSVSFTARSLSPPSFSSLPLVPCAPLSHSASRAQLIVSALDLRKTRPSCCKHVSLPCPPCTLCSFSFSPFSLFLSSHIHFVLSVRLSPPLSPISHSHPLPPPSPFSSSHIQTLQHTHTHHTCTLPRSPLFPLFRPQARAGCAEYARKGVPPQARRARQAAGPLRPHGLHHLHLCLRLKLHDDPAPLCLDRAVCGR